MHVCTEFEQWKSKFEMEHTTSFVLSTGQKTVQSNKMAYYYCNRSGYFVSKSRRRRCLKSQGTAKLDQYCTAGLQCMLLENGRIQVEVIKTHYGHECTLGYIRIPTENRLFIAKQLAEGVSFDNLLDKVRDSVSTHLERIHLLTRKDLSNIERAFSLCREKRHSIDAVSVRLWVEEMKSTADNPVLFYKEQGSDVAEVGRNYGLGKHDFALVLQSSLQADLLKNCGDNKVVCADATHGTNTYNFQLISVLIIDEFGEGFPAGWCLSNREDGVLLNLFFSHLKEKTGSFSPKWFMSDMAEQYYSSWISVFGGSPNKLLCVWHVDRAWRKNILCHIKNKEEQATTYYTIRVLLEEMNTQKFECLLQQTLNKWKDSPSTSDFYEYFKQYYAQRQTQWAGCYRKRAFINTNMYVESFHRVLKHVYLKGTVNKRMDNLINVLMRYSRDKAFDRILKIEKGKPTKRCNDITKRHNISLELPLDLIVQVEDQWHVKSKTKPITYRVEKNEPCNSDCWIRCRPCGICIHDYTCTCPDSLLHGTICKHVHLVVRSTAKPTVIDVHKPKPFTTAYLSKGSTKLLSSVTNKFKVGPIKDRLHQKLANIGAGLNTTNSGEVLTAIERNLNACINILKVYTYDGEQIEPANKKIKQQRNFHSTKRKRETTRIRLTKPTFLQKATIAYQLLLTEDTSLPRSSIG